MHNRAARLVLLVLFLAALSTSAYLFWRAESQASAAAQQASAFDAAARSAERALVEVRASQRGYVAAGQGGDFWTGRVSHSVDALRTSIAALRTEAIDATAKTTLDRVVAALDDFMRVDKRAVEYVRRDQRLLASDVIFADAQEFTDAALASLEQARTAELAARADTIDVTRRRGVFAITSGAAAAILIVLLLLPQPNPPRVAAAPAPTPAERSTPLRLNPPRRVEQTTVVADDKAWSPPHQTPVQAEMAPVQPVDPVSPPAEAPVETAAAAGAATDFTGVASLCVDLARVVDTRALPSLLDRAATLLDASGIILWIADPDGNELNPIFAQGYPQQLVNRLGTIPRNAENATAAAFRTSLLQTVMADKISAGAIAAPIVTPAGCVGVMAAEVLHDSERQNMKLAAATIVAAQLATLVGPPAARNHAKTAG
ncbi:MAG TPA: GAF domain-containing protein [Vicinamibacterales bacterium]|jgi:CHASE3 domain sensor protein